MKTFFIAVTILSAILSPITSQIRKTSIVWTEATTHSYSFDNYMNEFEKKYDDSEEYNLRKAIFHKNLDIINEINSNPEYTWKAGVNHLTDRTESEYRSLFGYNRAQAFASKMMTINISPVKLDVVKDLPTHVDWREKGVVGPIRNQKSCGSCWAFATAAVMESHVAIKSGVLSQLSPQQLVDCAPNPDECGGKGGCQGATSPVAFEYIQSAGMTTENLYPYLAKDDKCDVSRIRKTVSIEGYVKLPENDYDSLMTALANEGPVSISVAADIWKYYKGGVLNGNCGWIVNHAVVAVGYGTDSKLGDYWLVRNSWGESWGENGYIRVAREKNASEVKCGIDTAPEQGSACKGGPKEVKVCGLCGILSDSSYPTGANISK